jgi:hypothetical protein
MSKEFFMYYIHEILYLSETIEVVLAVLLQSFKFEPVQGKEIRFNMAGIQWPQVVGGPNKPALPLKVSLVESK